MGHYEGQVHYYGWASFAPTFSDTWLEEFWDSDLLNWKAISKYKNFWAYFYKLGNSGTSKLEACATVDREAVNF